MNPRKRLAGLVLEPRRVEAVAAEDVPALVVLTAALQAGLVARMAASNGPAVPTGKEMEGMLTAVEVAKRLGVHVKTVQRYVRTSGLPVCRLPGGDLRFHWLEVSRWLAERKEIRT